MKRTRLETIRTVRYDEPLPDGEPRRYRDGRGYVRLRWNVAANTYVEEYEHRVVAGCPHPQFHVHHVNGVKDDNRPENLELLTAAEHARLHGGSRRRRYGPYLNRVSMEKNLRARETRERRAAEADEMADLYASGLTLPQIADLVGIDHSNVYRRLKDAGVVFRTKSDYAAELAAQEVAEKYLAGRSQKGLASEYRVTAARIRQCLKEAGCPVRKPGRPKNHAAMPENRARRLVRERSDGRCEICGERKATEWQHRKNRSQGGEWEPSNGLDACSPCHRMIHAHPHLSDSNGWTVLSWEDWQSKPVKMWWGYVLLDDEGDWTNFGAERPVDEHVTGCDWWTSNLCDCGGVA